MSTASGFTTYCARGVGAERDSCTNKRLVCVCVCVQKRLETYRRPNVFPQRAHAQENGFSLVCVLSCLWTCSTRLKMKDNVS